ncbi:hypothetical protein [Chitinilyticum piscinae]|uniref:Uncharacterized protein n=1 Tax=Chitinilyticum piscinae TaxID=2866724 RepID=A0A8J7FQ91_9NEIS|nr:hypothetical protein [Chitinilyticum piscinae]MBE9610274.1 hypothetical protein [Chitinilyticum piscinae]
MDAPATVSAQELDSLRQRVREGDPQVRPLLKQALRRAQARDDLDCAMPLAELAARAAWGVLDYRQLQHYARLLGRLALRGDSLDYRLLSLQIQARAAQEQQRHQLTLRLWFTVMTLAEQQERPAALCDACLGLSNLLLQEQQPTLALEAIAFAHHTACDYGLARLRFRCALFMLSQLVDSSPRSELQGWLDELEAADQHTMDHHWLVDLANLQARLANREKDYRTAQLRASKAEHLARRSHYQWGLQQALQNRAEIAAGQQQWSEAIALLQQSTYDPVPRALPAAQQWQLAQWLEASGQAQPALAVYQQWHALRVQALAGSARSKTLPCGLRRQLALQLDNIRLRLANHRLTQRLAQLESTHASG